MTRYCLAAQVTLTEEPQGGGNLFISHPQRIIKLSVAGVAALHLLCGRESGELNPELRQFTVNLENQGIIVRQFPNVLDEQLPFVSIVIPTYNRPQMLNLCLESIVRLDYPTEKFEIIVVDDASPEPPNLNWAPKARLISLVVNSGQGAARNLAVREASGEVIAFLDDDCLADQQWLRTLVPCFQDPNVAVVGGSVEAAELNNALARYEQIQSPLFMGAVQRKVRKASALSYLPTCNLLIRKADFLAVGGFDESMRVGEDVDLCWRVLAIGADIYYLPGGRVYHHHRASLLPFLRRRFSYGQSEAKLQGKHSGEKRRLILFPGHQYIAFGVLGASFLAASRYGIEKGLLLGMAILIILGFLNLGVQVVRNLYRLKSSGYNWHFAQVWKPIKRSHDSALYIYCQNFSRYYSILTMIIFLLVSVPLVFIILILHLWPAVAIYRLKKPALSLGNFVLYHSLENCFYQAGVLSGCWHEHNWRPLSMNFKTGEEVGIGS